MPTRAERRPGRLGAIRERARATRGGRIAWRVGITVLGFGMIVVGIILLPLPGPGWVIIFAGLGLLATEYEWAQRLLGYVRTQLARWARWLSGRNRFIQTLVGISGIVVLAAIALFGWWWYRR